MPPGVDYGEQLTTAERRNAVLELRKAGMDYRTIAKKIAEKFPTDELPKGWDSRYACKDVKRVLKKVRDSLTENAEQVRQLEIERLNDLLRAVWARATRKSDHKAIDRALKIMKRRADLLGLDAPEQLDVTSGGESFELVVGNVPEDAV